ncbi:MAG: hypothetical protein AB7K68_16070 [Bacteriovoracia bacterium]
MKQLTLKQVIALTLTTFACASSAWAEGGASTGGGLLINKKLAEDHAVHAKDLPDFDVTDTYIRAFEERIPRFGAILRQVVDPSSEPDVNERIRPISWFALPGKDPCAKIEPKTRLVGSKGACQSGREVYVSKELTSDTALGKAEGKETRGKLYFHEALMMMLPDKDDQKVHQLIAFMNQRQWKPSQVELRQALLDFGFTGIGLEASAYKTKDQIDGDMKIKSQARTLSKADIDGRLEKFIARTKEICGSNASSEAQVAQMKKAFASIDQRLSPALLRSASKEVKEQFEREQGHGFSTKYYVEAMAANRMASITAAIFADFNSRECRLGAMSCGEPGEHVDMGHYELTVARRLFWNKYYQFNDAERMNRICTDATNIHAPMSKEEAEEAHDNESASDDSSDKSESGSAD